ncbi:MAG: AsmA family protein, partial [Bacteroidales bacterium]|nr:AsmA family protein [Bacteroidales bacterium]
MKKAYKVTWISLASLLGVIIVVVLLALYLVLTPKRLTSLVNKYAEDYVTCDVNVGKVDLTLFKTFPDAGIEINDLLLMNPTQGWTSDTLAYIDECIVSVNLRKLLFGDEIIVNTCMLNGGFVNAFFDTEGNTNLDIMPPSEAEEVEPEVEEAESSYAINIDKVKINNLRLNYTDLAENTVATINGLSLLAKASIIDDIIDGDIIEVASPTGCVMACKRGKRGATSLSANNNGFNDYFLFNDLRNGPTTIHSWDIIDTTDR